MNSLKISSLQMAHSSFKSYHFFHFLFLSSLPVTFSPCHLTDPGRGLNGHKIGALFVFKNSVYVVSGWGSIVSEPSLLSGQQERHKCLTEGRNVHTKGHNIYIYIFIYLPANFVLSSPKFGGGGCLEMLKTFESM